MKLVVSHFVDPVTAVVVIKSQHSLISLAQVPDAHSSISTTGGEGVKPTLVVSNVENLVNVCREAQIS